MFTCVLGRDVAFTVLLVPKPFEGRRQCRGQRSENKEYPSVEFEERVPERGLECVVHRQ